MARINLDDLSLRELLKLDAEIKAAIPQKKAAEQRALKAKISDLAANNGFTVDELFGTTKRGVAAGTKVAPKYMNPDNPIETWTGRGRQPRWMVAALKKGGKAEKFLIK